LSAPETRESSVTTLRFDPETKVPQSARF